jgi:hypothetical protein
VPIMSSPSGLTEKTDLKLMFWESLLSGEFAFHWTNRTTIGDASLAVASSRRINTVRKSSEAIRKNGVLTLALTDDL